MNVIIYFNGILQNLDDFQGSNDSSFVFRQKDEGGGAAVSYSPNLTLVGDAYQYIRQQIIEKPVPSLEEISVEIYDACCSDEDGNPLLLMLGKIPGSEVTWCEVGENCGSCEITIVDDSQDAKALACLKNTLIWDKKPKLDGSGVSDGEDSFRVANFSTYCNDIKPDFLQEVILLLGLILKIVLLPVLLVVATLVTIVNGILFFINLLGANIPLFGGDVNFYDDALSFITAFDELILPCGYLHKTPFIHSYLINVCDICGLGLQSSLFGVGGVYHNTMRLDAQFVAGSKNVITAFDNYEKNKPNLNGIQFLDEFEAFNIDWRITNGTLVVEREDFQFGNLWFDLRDIQEQDIQSLCFSVTEERPPAYGEYRYTKDGVDNTGDEVNSEWADAVFDWNVPINPAQTGLKETVLFFGTAQFRQDANANAVSPLDKPLYTLGYLNLQDFQKSMLIEKGVAAFPKLLQWDGVSDRFRATIARRSSANGNGVFDYNTDWYIKSNYQDSTGTSYNTAYQNLFEIDDPRNTSSTFGAAGLKQRRYTLQIIASCDVVRTLSADKFVIIPIGGVYKEAVVDEIEYNTDSKILTIQGKI